MLTLSNSSNKSFFADQNNDYHTLSMFQDSLGKLNKFCTPVTLPYTDLQGRIIQLWKCKHLLFATVEENSKFKFISGNKIHNALQPQERDHLLLNRLEKCELKRWHFSYQPSKGEIVIWPYLIAAGKNDENKSAAQIKIDHIKKHTKYSDLSAAWKEANNKPVTFPDGTPCIKSDGTPYNHQKEVKEAQRGLKKVIESNKIKLGHNPSPEERVRLEKELAEASKKFAVGRSFTNRECPAPLQSDSNSRSSCQFSISNCRF